MVCGVHIGIDFDDTISINESVWAKIIQTMIQAGWDVSIVSIRSNKDDNRDIFEFADSLSIPAFVTHGKQKAPFMDNIGRPVSIWIDDFPVGIPDPTALLGTAISCDGMGEPVDPNNELPGYITLRNSESA